MINWTQQELYEMAQADAEIDEDDVLTMDEIESSRQRDMDVLDGQLDFRDLHYKLYDRAYNRKYHAEHKNEDNLRCRRYHAKNREKENQRSKNWRESNLEYCKTYQDSYYAVNKASILAKKREQYWAKKTEKGCDSNA